MSNYYVYVYIDPRNYEEFYYGKGKGSRKEAHLNPVGDSKKAKRIRNIERQGLSPIIRVIASDLTEDQALLIEATLIWKLGKYTDNIHAGHYKDNFRPHNTLHIELGGFDYQNGMYYYNVGEDVNSFHRSWEDYREYGFIAGGQAAKIRNNMMGFQDGDVIVAYLKRHGYVGVGRITQNARMIRDVKIGSKRLLDLPLVCKSWNVHMNDKDLSEYVCLVKWIKTFPRTEAKWKPRSGLYTTQLIKASLYGQPKTIDFIDSTFGLNLKKLVS